MKISFVTTIFNEEKTIEKFLDSLFSQTQLPDEIIIVDGGSTDHTIAKLENHKEKFLLLIKKGNRSVGRNVAIKHAKGDIIVCSDAGNILDKKWLENITKPFKDKNNDVVAGFYKGKAENILQKCLIPYALVMPDKVDPNNFLPSARSMAFKKSIWKKIGGFPEKYSHNEDYVFANQLKKINASIFFAKDAIVYWFPRNTFNEAFNMFYRFALGDIEAKIFRSKVLLLFARYFLGLYLIFLSILYQSVIGEVIILSIFIIYLLWAIQKNYRYVLDIRALYLLPAIQLTSDAAVIFGSVVGLLKIIIQFNYLTFIKQNKLLFVILTIYISFLVFTLKWGIPNQNHPFPYHMDEWHQLQAVANTFRFGTPNTVGSANGTMFHFLFSGFYLLPFTLLQIINPFELQIDNFQMRERIFEIFRFQTIIFGSFSILIINKIAQLINASKKLVITLFTFSPIWLILSGYFKYDIALIFWILFSLYYIVKFSKLPSNRNFIIAAIPASLAIAIKVSAIPLLPIYIFSFFLFSPSIRKNIKFLFIGVIIFIFTLLLFGFPDTLFGKGNLLLYLFENIVQGPQSSSNFILGMSPYTFLILRHYPVIFGHGLIFLFIISCIFWIYIWSKNGFSKYKHVLFLFFCFLIFFISILPLKIYAGGNRSLVLLPFFTLLVSLTWGEFKIWPRLKLLVLVMLIIALSLQIYESSLWAAIKIGNSPQEVSSEWIQKNIPKNSTIGIENVPIYQNIPDIIQKEFYFDQYNINQEKRYKYQIIDAESGSLPQYIVITSGDIEKKLVKESPKKDLLNRLSKEKYIILISFSPIAIKYLPLINDVDYYFSWLGAPPLTTTIYVYPILVKQ